MSKHDKLLERLLGNPKDFKYDELKRLLNGFGYVEENRGRTSGSAVLFYNKVTQDKISIHKPHPSNIIKTYIIKLIIDHITNGGLINTK